MNISDEKKRALRKQALREAIEQKLNGTYEAPVIDDEERELREVFRSL